MGGTMLHLIHVITQTLLNWLKAKLQRQHIFICGYANGSYLQ